MLKSGGKVWLKIVILYKQYFKIYKVMKFQIIIQKIAGYY